MHQFCLLTSWPGWPPEVWAAWTQAIGSIAAIVVAIFVPVAIRFADKKHERAKEASKARSLALDLLPSLERFMNDVRAAANILSKAQTAAEYRESAAKLTIPDSLQARIHRLHEIGPIANTIEKLIYKASGLQRAIEINALLVAHNVAPTHIVNGKTVLKPIAELAELRKLRRDLREAVKAIEHAFRE